MKGKTKKSIIVLVLLLAVGFAAVTTTLTINGTIRLGANQNNFAENLRFVANSAVLTYTGDVDADETDEATVSADGKTITFTTKTLKNIGNVATLTYDIENKSQYTAEFTGINCKVFHGEGNDVTTAVKNNTEYITLDEKNFKDGENNIKLAPNETLAGRTLEVALRQSYVGDDSTTATQYTIQCTIAASGLSE